MIHEHVIDRIDVDRGCSAGVVGMTGDQIERSQARASDEVGGGCGLMVGYVDDGAYSYASEDSAVLSHVLTYKYNKLAEWMNSNKLVINPEKTHLMVMGSRKHRNKRRNVRMDHIIQGDLE